MRQIEPGQVRRLIIAHKDCLVRFGFEWFAAFCTRHGTELLVVNGDTPSPKQELVQDLLAIMHIFSVRLRGLRAYKCRHAGKRLELIEERHTTQECCRCHHRQDMPLWKRTYRCGNPECQLVLDRDVNSAINILQRFLARLGPHTFPPDWLERAVCSAQVQQSTRLNTF